MTEIPNDLERFKAWADRECGKWPSSLQTLAFNAWRGQETIATFREAYEQQFGRG